MFSSQAWGVGVGGWGEEGGNGLDPEGEKIDGEGKGGGLYMYVNCVSICLSIACCMYPYVSIS